MEKKLGSLFDGIGDCEKNEKKEEEDVHISG